MSFELFKGRGERGRYNCPVVTIQASGGIVMNGVAYEQLSEPRFLKLYYDEETQCIGLESAMRSEEYAYPVRRSGESGYSVSVRSFLKYFDIDISATKRFRATKEGDMLIAALSDPIHVRKKRRSDAVEAL